jgi:hypothetical protein
VRFGGIGEGGPYGFDVISADGGFGGRHYGGRYARGSRRMVCAIAEGRTGCSRLMSAVSEVKFTTIWSLETRRVALMTSPFQMTDFLHLCTEAM